MDVVCGDMYIHTSARPPPLPFSPSVAVLGRRRGTTSTIRYDHRRPSRHPDGKHIIFRYIYLQHVVLFWGHLGRRTPLSNMVAPARSHSPSPAGAPIPMADDDASPSPAPDRSTSNDPRRYVASPSLYISVVSFPFLFFPSTTPDRLGAGTGAERHRRGATGFVLLRDRLEMSWTGGCWAWA